MNSSLPFCVRIACAAIVIGLIGTTATAADWKPERNVEWVVPTGPGSGVDNTARTLQMIMQGAKLVDTPMSVVNKSGGSYGVALNYLAQFNGDGQRLMIQTSTPLSALLTGQLSADYFAFTPIANLITDSPAAGARMPEYIMWFAGVLACDAITAIPFARLRQENKAKRFAFLRIFNILVNISLNLFFLLLCPPK